MMETNIVHTYTPILKTTDFESRNLGGNHESTDWVIKKITGEVVWQSLNDTENLTKMQVPYRVFELDETYIVEVRHNGTYASSEVEREKLIVKNNCDGLDYSRKIFDRTDCYFDNLSVISYDAKTLVVGVCNSEESRNEVKIYKYDGLDYILTKTFFLDFNSLSKLQGVYISGDGNIIVAHISNDYNYEITDSYYSYTHSGKMIIFKKENNEYVQIQEIDAKVYDHKYPGTEIVAFSGDGKTIAYIGYEYIYDFSDNEEYENIIVSIYKYTNGEFKLFQEIDIEKFGGYNSINITYNGDIIYVSDKINTFIYKLNEAESNYELFSSIASKIDHKSGKKYFFGVSNSVSADGKYFVAKMIDENIDPGQNGSEFVNIYKYNGVEYEVIQKIKAGLSVLFIKISADGETIVVGYTSEYDFYYISKAVIYKMNKEDGLFYLEKEINFEDPHINNFNISKTGKVVKFDHIVGISKSFSVESSQMYIEYYGCPNQEDDFIPSFKSVNIQKIDIKGIDFTIQGEPDNVPDSEEWIAVFKDFKLNSINGSDHIKDFTISIKDANGNIVHTDVCCNLYHIYNTYSDLYSAYVDSILNGFRTEVKADLDCSTAYIAEIDFITRIGLAGKAVKSFTTEKIEIQTPEIEVEIDQCHNRLVLYGSDFRLEYPGNVSSWDPIIKTHTHTDWVVKDMNGKVVRQSLNDTENLTSIEVPINSLKTNKQYTVEVAYYHNKCKSNTAVKTFETPSFELLNESRKHTNFIDFTNVRNIAISRCGRVIAVVPQNEKRVDVYMSFNGNYEHYDTLLPPDGYANLDFGASLAINRDGSRIFVGAPTLYSPYTLPKDRVFIYDMNYSFPIVISPPPLFEFTTDYSFGKSIAINEDGSVLIVGAPDAYKEYTVLKTGGAYLFTESPYSGIPLFRKAFFPDDDKVGSKFGATVNVTSGSVYDSVSASVFIGAPNEGAIYSGYFSKNRESYIPGFEYLAETHSGLEKIIDGDDNYPGLGEMIVSAKNGEILITKGIDEKFFIFMKEYSMENSRYEFKLKQEFSPICPSEEFSIDILENGAVFALGAKDESYYKLKSGGVYLYRFDASNSIYKIHRKLVPSNPKENGNFGSYVRIKNSFAEIKVLSYSPKDGELYEY